MMRFVENSLGTCHRQPVQDCGSVDTPKDLALVSEILKGKE